MAVAAVARVNVRSWRLASSSLMRQFYREPANAEQIERSHPQRQKRKSRLRLRQTDIVSATECRRIPGPLRSCASWVASGLTLQAVGAGGVAAYVWLKVRHQNIGGHVTAATIRLAWHGEIHTRQGLTVLVAGTLIYAAGSVLMARPYATRPMTLFVAVPVAAVAGMLVLGVLAFIVAVLIAALANSDLGFGLDFGGDRRRAKRPRQ